MSKLYMQKGGKSKSTLIKGKKEVTSQFKAKPTARHAWCDFQKVWNDSFIQPSNTLVSNDDSNCIPDRLILISHTIHGVDLESPSENIAMTLLELLLLEPRGTSTYNGYVQV